VPLVAATREWRAIDFSPLSCYYVTLPGGCLLRSKRAQGPRLFPRIAKGAPAVKVAARLLLIFACILTPIVAAADAAGPSVTITSPEPGLTIATDSVSVQATYSAPDGSVINQVDLLIDNAVVETRAIDPPQASGTVSFAWGASHYLDGTHRVAVRATDSGGRLVTAEISVLLGRSQPGPSVRVSAPLASQTVFGITSVDIDAGQRSLVKYVIFLVDDVFKAMSNVSPFSYLWDTTRYLNGLHRLQVKIYFKAGTESLSPVVEVRVDNPGGGTTMQSPQPAAVIAPEPQQAPARAAESALPPPMRTESLSTPPEAIQIADAVVAAPGTAPFVSPAGDLVIPVPPVPVQSAPAAATPALPATPEPPVSPSPSSLAADVPAVPAAPAPPTVSDAPAPVAPAGELAAPLRGEPKPAPVSVALLPTPEAPRAPARMAPSAPASVRPAQTSAAGMMAAPVSAATQAAVIPPRTTTQVALLPPRAEEKAPAPRVVAAPPAPENVYVVQPNDCLWSIAAAHNVSVATLMKMNEIPESGVIQPGQRLRLPFAQIYCDGEPVAVDTAPIVADGRAIVPLRAVVEKAGGTVTWEPADRRAGASLNQHQVLVTIGSKTARLDGGEATMASAATLAGNRTLVPLRFLGEAFDLVLEYQAGVIRIATR